VADRVFVLNGPNLNMLGRREPQTYGRTTLAQIESRCLELAKDIGFDLLFRQSNSEADLIEWVHQAFDESASVIINPAGLSTRSVALYDALRMLRQPVVEVHITNIFRRESLYHAELVTARAAGGLIAGFGADVYEMAMRGLRELLDHRV
jgi:3-dehydroquinate dehydratase-2